MGAIKAISLLLIVFVSPWAWADKPAPYGPPAPTNPATPDSSRSGAVPIDLSRNSSILYAERSSNTLVTPTLTPADQPKPVADIPPDSRAGLHMMTDGESPALEYKLSDNGSMRLRGTKRGAKLIMLWRFK
ncbi:hypothetical protein [Undibacterium sp.]|jgi:hypothetical protein|uniref:hypothetical protein n=1 Tax=Undibacterium sp. TaxID=1914977 RepID=UPI002CBC7A91|nr:hypothetical protein [Undibacterium sp.]HTD03330.1 hypothetical protein [Undibacterium sp.]